MGFLPTALAQADLTDSEIAKLLEIRVTYTKGGVGIVAGIVDEHDARVIAYGKPSKESTQTLDGDSVFEIGSISKVFAAILLADMIEQGEVRLDDPVSKYLPASVTVPRRNGREITLKDLTTHSSGLSREPGNFVTTGFVLKRLITCPFCGFDNSNDPARRVAVRIDRELLKAYVGKYRLPSGEILTITAEPERLFATREGKKQVEIFAENTRDFFWKVPDAKDSFKVNDVRATFVRNDKAEVTHLVLHQPGMRASAAKIE